MPSLQVLLKKEDLESQSLQDRVVIVLDILFATSSIVHAFAQGVRCVYPAFDQQDAERIAQGLPESLRAGEYLAARLPGFLPATPLLLAREPLQGKTLVYSTTNGTVALRRAAAAPYVYVGALLNCAALVSHIRRVHPDHSVLLVCSGSGGRFNLEDFYGAGYYVRTFAEHCENQLNDAARAAALLARAYGAQEALLASRVGRMFQARGEPEEVSYSAQADTLDVVARLEGDVLRRVTR
jgi:2-phosphosulfolactate phosphatase